MKNNLLTLLFLSVILTVNAQNNNYFSPRNNIQISKNAERHGRYDRNPSQSFYQNMTQGEVEIGDGTYEYRYPVSTWFNYSYTQTIFMASELGGTADDITKLWYYYPGNNLQNSNNWEIYIGNTTKSSYANKEDFIPINDMTKVFDGTFPSLTGPGWVEFDITDFHYDGTSNLVIAVHDKSPNNDGPNNYFYCTDLGNDSIKRTLIAQSDSGDIDLQNPVVDVNYYFLYEADVIPNIRLLFGQQQAHDLGITHVNDDFIISGESLTPQITVKNVGVNTENNFSVTLSISGTSYNETVNVSNSIANGQKIVVDMPQWNSPATGNYTFTASVVLNGDTNSDNNQMVTSFDVVDPVYDTNNVWSFALDTNKNHGVINKTSGVYSSLADDMDLSEFLSCGEYINGVVYGIEYLSNNVYILIPDGRKKKVGVLSGIGAEHVLGLAYDVVDNTKYILTFNTSDVMSKLYTADANWNCTLVGNISSDSYLSIASDNQGNLYGIDGSSYSFVSINKTTATPTFIGDVGYPIDFAQDIGGDHTTGEIYGTIFDDDYLIGRFGTFNKTTGHFNQIAELDYINYSMCAVIPSDPNSVNDNSLSEIKINPNPSKGAFYFNVKDNYKAEVFDISGKMLNSKELSEIDNKIFIHNAGVYFIRLSNKKGAKVFKVIVRE